MGENDKILLSDAYEKMPEKTMSWLEHGKYDGAIKYLELTYGVKRSEERRNVSPSAPPEHMVIDHQPSQSPQSPLAQNIGIDADGPYPNFPPPAYDESDSESTVCSKLKACFFNSGAKETNGVEEESRNTYNFNK